MLNILFTKKRLGSKKPNLPKKYKEQNYEIKS